MVEMVNITLSLIIMLISPRGNLRKKWLSKIVVG